MIARSAFAEGGSVPLIGEPAVETVLEDETGKQQRQWLPKPPPEYESQMSKGALVPVGGGKVVKAEPVAPVFRSVAHDALADPQAMGGMKQGTPQQWVNALTKHGAKKDEIEWLGLHEGHPNEKIPREVMLAKAKANMPQLTEKLRGERGKEQVMTEEGDDDYVDDDHDPYENLEVGYPNWETDDPDEDYITERARERLDDDIDEKLEDPTDDNVVNNLKPAIDDFSKKWLRVNRANPDGSVDGIDPNTLNRGRVYDFMRTAIEKGWAFPEKAENVIKAGPTGRIGHHEWNDFVDDAMKGFYEQFGERRPTDESPQLSLEGENGTKGEPSTTEEFAEELSQAARHLHGMHETAEPLTPYKRSRAGAGTFDGPSLYHHLSEKVKDDLQTQYEDEEREFYRQDDEAPSSSDIEVEHEGGDTNPLTYRLHHQGYSGDIDIIDPRGRHIRTVHSEDEARSHIMTHAVENYDVGSEPESRGPKYETREIPDDNLTVPAVQGGPSYKQYALPGIENYREHLLQFKPQGNDYTGGHYPDPNVLMHMRYGDLKDANGKRMLYLDELQSDWHQRARESGYMTGDVARKIAEAKEEYPKVEKEYTGAIDHLVDGLGLTGFSTHTSGQRIAALLLLDPHNMTGDEARGARNAFDHLSHREWPLLGFDSDPANQDLIKMPAAVLKMQEFAKESLGPDFKQKAMAVNDTLSRMRALDEAMQGNLTPDAPWKDSSQWGQLAMKRAMRVAADYGYDGVALSPGWVQNKRWPGHDHLHLYDKIFAGALDKTAKEAGLQTTKATIPAITRHANNHGISDDGTQGNVHAVYLTDEARKKIKQEPFKLMRRGGRVRKAGGGAVTPPGVRQALRLVQKYLAPVPGSVYKPTS